MTDLAAWEDEGYRAIGRWWVEFSKLIGGMRTNMENRLRKDADNPELVMLAFVGAPAGAISDSFFGMCRLVADLDDPEANIANQLQKEVNEEIQTRNKIAHGDWLIGSGPPGTDDSTVHAHLLRTYAKAPHFRVETYTADDLDKRSNRLRFLRAMVWQFGQLALALPMLTTSGTVQGGTYRVRDVLSAKDVPKGGKGGRVIRGGPRASEIL